MTEQNHEHAFSILTPDYVIDAFESLGYLSDGRMLTLNSYENRVYQVGVDEGEPVILKFYRPERWTDEQILEEHTFCYELLEQDVSAVPPVRNEEGQTLFHDENGMRFSVFQRRGGRAPELDNLDNLYTLGQHLGRMHQVGQASDFKHRPTLDIESYGHQSREFLLSHFVPESLRAAYETLTQDLLKLIEEQFAGMDSIQWIRCHGDCHVGNMLWRDDAPNFVDFDDARMAPAIQDLWMLLSGEMHQQQEQLVEIIEGYEMFNSFKLSELALIEPLRTLRMMHYASWLARRWDDPAFPMHFPWFNTDRYWGEHILELREQLTALQDKPLTLPN